MLVSTTSSTPTPGSTSSASNTLEPSPQPASINNPFLNTAGSASNSRPPSRAPSILDSPTLARVERARLRLEATSQQLSGSNSGTINRDPSTLERGIIDSKKDAVPWHQVWTHMKRLSHASKVNSTNTLTAHKTDVGLPAKCILFPDKTASLKDAFYAQQVYFRPDMQSLLAGRIPVASMTGPIKRGLLWQQRDRLFSRWKERYFVLTRDYLHCFKRASGSANERASDMGQFIFKVKLVDVEKVEWLNRRSYSAIGLLLGREGRVLLRCDDGLEDWFELLEECTLTSKERRRALKIAQGPRSRASLAAPVSHASLQSQHFGLGGTYSSALDDWLMTNGSGRHKIGAGSVTGLGGTNPFLFSDSVPDLSALNNENHNHHLSGIATNHSTPQKIPYASNGNTNNMSRYSNGYASQNNSFSSCSGLYGSPRRIFINSSFGSNHVVDEEGEEGEVQLRRPHIFRNNSSENGNEVDRDWLYRKPRAPTDMRHSVQPMLPTHTAASATPQQPAQSNGGNNGNANAAPSANTNTNTNANAPTTADHDCSAHDSGLDTPPSTHRPSSYRELSQRDSTETTVSSSRGTLLNSPGGSFRAKHLNQVVTNLNQVNALNGSRYSVQERILKIRNEEDRYSSIKSNAGIAANNRLNHNELYDPNQNRYYKPSSLSSPSPSPLTPQHTPHKVHHGGHHHYQHQQQHHHHHLNQANNANNNGTLNGNIPNGSAIFRERYQHPALAAIINEAQSMKFRDRSYSDCQQMPPRRSNNNNPNASPMTPRRNIAPIFGTPTRV